MTIPSLLGKYKKGEKLTMLTSYDATFSRVIDEAGIDMMLVGDSLGMVIQGNDSTIPVTLDDVIYHSKCVSRGVANALIVADMPFMSYQASQTQAMLSAGRALKEGCANAVKLEGGMEMVRTAELMVAAGIPVMAHIGLKPQRVHQMGGYRIQGKTAEDAKLLIKEAQAFEKAGAFSIVLEGIAIETAGEITASISIPTIGISSGPYCSGQVLVIYDMLGMNPEFQPKFLKVYMNGSRLVSDAVKSFIKEVREGKFPTERNGFKRA